MSNYADPVADQLLPTVVPLKVRISDGSVAPEPLVTKRTAATREEILAGLTVKERMLVHALATALDGCSTVYASAVKHGDRPELVAGVTALLQGFQDATGVDYADGAWDVT